MLRPFDSINMFLARVFIEDLGIAWKNNDKTHSWSNNY